MSKQHHPACDPGWGPRNYRCHPECKVGLPFPAGEGAQETQATYPCGCRRVYCSRHATGSYIPAALPPERAALVERLEQAIAAEEASGDDACANLDLLREADAALTTSCP